MEGSRAAFVLSLRKVLEPVLGSKGHSSRDPTEWVMTSPSEPMKPGALLRQCFGTTTRQHVASDLNLRGGTIA
eukprot:5531204-Amphidinium_carterae.1